MINLFQYFQFQDLRLDGKIHLYQNIIFLENKEDIYYTPADNPYDTYKLLNKITKNLPQKKELL